jgi:hypothetical protein
MVFKQPPSFSSKKLEHLGVLTKIKVMLHPFDGPQVQRIKSGRTKFERALSTTNGGRRVKVHSQWAWAQCIV